MKLTVEIAHLISFVGLMFLVHTYKYIYIYLMNMCIYLQGINCFGKDMYQEK